MGKRGPKPMPTRLRELHGNPSGRRMPFGEPEPGGLADVAPPKHLAPAAKAEWRRLAPELIRLGLLTVADLPTFAAWCSAWGDFIGADRALQRDGIVTKGKEGQPVRSPWFLVKAKAVDQLVKLGDRFGLSPTARTALATGESPPAPTGLGRNTNGASLGAYLAEKPDSLK